MQILKYKNVFLAISLTACGIAALCILAFGFKKSIDFTGGAKVIFSVKGSRWQTYPDESTIRPQDLYSFRQDKLKGINKMTLVAPSPSQEVIQNSLTENFGENKLTKVNEDTYSVTLRDLKEEDYQKLKTVLAGNASTTVDIKEFAMTGPSISSEIVSKSILGFLLVIFAIGIFIWFAFRGVSYPVSSWKYGVIIILTLIHDMIIPAGVFAWLGHYRGVEVDALFVVAILTILGISISDTIVIFDRVRENMKSSSKNTSFEEVVGKSLNQSLVRSIATSLAVIIVLLCLVFFGPDSTKYFAITLTIGMFVGTYSSIFFASPLLVWVSKNWR